ncbi:helix-turn-helix domain-containing protein [Conchiformibius steedae]|uniref:XRE family transcriptional regulator n=1 Tax=Conchiformibius steedae TaxID=153493 RepID=A0A3P2AAE9_9NEIS|nr:helix-turn-helix transcriptional regulator [Conchiformibius steedae]RRD90603.1 XRE family transcriptional regulator [Conchiformibius steedae]
MAQLTSTEIDVLIGKRIQLKRKESGLSAEKLSELIDISQQQLSRYERGTNKINVAHLVNIANFLKTPISYFFSDCMDHADWNSDEQDIYWQMLTRTQKETFITFLKTFSENK